MIAFSVLSRIRSSTLPSTSPLVSLTSVPMTRDARMAVVCPVTVGIFLSFDEVDEGRNGSSGRGFRSTRIAVELFPYSHISLVDHLSSRTRRGQSQACNRSGFRTVG